MYMYDGIGACYYTPTIMDNIIHAPTTQPSKSMASQHRLEVLLGHLRAGQPHSAACSRSAGSAGHGSTAHNYTLDCPNLTREQRRLYEENGYVVVPRLVRPELLDAFARRFRQICSGEVERPTGLMMMRDVGYVKKAGSDAHASETTVNKIQDWKYDPVLSQYYRLPELLHYVEAFTGPDIMAMHTMLINKPPDPGTKSSRHPMHQDLHYFPFGPADRIVCSWTAMQVVNRQNGCLVVVPGTHKGELLPHEYPKWEGGVNKMYHGIQDYDPSCPRVHLEMGPGDTVFFHPLLIHGSGANKTTGYRKAISCHFASSHCEYVDEVGETQQELAAEVLDIARKKLGDEANFTYQDTWRFRGECLKGERINL